MLARKLGLVLLPACAAAMAGTGWAQQPAPAQSGALRQACRSDYVNYCSSAPTGGGAALACLRQHSSSLSPACAQAIGGLPGTAAPAAAPATEAPRAPPANPPAANRQPEAGGGAIQTTCGGDFRRLCQGTQPGGGRVIACLSDHQSELSPSCRQTLMSLRTAR